MSEKRIRISHEWDEEKKNIFAQTKKADRENDDETELEGKEKIRCGSGGWAVASHTKNPWFKSHQWQIFLH